MNNALDMDKTIVVALETVTPSRCGQILSYSHNKVRQSYRHQALYSYKFLWVNLLVDYSLIRISRRPRKRHITSPRPIWNIEWLTSPALHYHRKTRGLLILGINDLKSDCYQQIQPIFHLSNTLNLLQYPRSLSNYESFRQSQCVALALSVIHALVYIDPGSKSGMTRR